MYERIANEVDGTPPLVRLEGTDVTSWLDAAGGRSFFGGLYRGHTPESAATADENVRIAFPEFASRVRCFGYDWLGRQFSLDLAHPNADDPELLLFELGSGEAYEFPFPWSAFHDVALFEDLDLALESEFFEQWLAAGGAKPGIDECVGWAVPLFLGGPAEFANLEVTDLDVYWTLVGQIRAQVFGAAPGTQVNGVELS